MNPIFVVFAIVVVLAVAAGVVHLVLTWMERRGWIWYRTKDRPRPSSLGLLEEIYQPSFEHVIDHAASEATKADRPGQGEPGFDDRESGADDKLA